MPESTDAGGRKPRVTDADLLDVFRSTTDPVLSTAEVSDALPIKRRGTLNRLRALEAEGRLDSKTVGGRNTVWWLAGTVTVDEERREPATDAARSDPGEESGEDADGTDDDTDRLTAALNRLDTTDDRRDAVRACVEYLRENETARKSGFVDDVYPDHPAGYKSTGGWWNTIGKEYLKALAEEYEPVEPPAKEGSHTWRWDA